MPVVLHPHDLHRLGDAPALTVIDVRSPAEYESAHIPGSRNVPLEHVEAVAPALASRDDLDVVVTCQTGPRAADAQRRLTAAGVPDVRVLDGGVTAWQRAGHPVRRGRRRWAMERQVRLVAGGLVLLGTVLGRRHGAGALLAGAIGGGLTVSAATDTCTMARVLSRLPYNRGPGFDLDAVTFDLWT